MTKQGDDETDLRRAFAALRREDAKKAPSFEALLARTPPRGGGRGLVPLGRGLLAASAAVAVIVVLMVGRRAPPPTPSLEQWTAPTDFLLETPGREILETVPAFGAPPAPLPRSVLP